MSVASAADYQFNTPGEFAANFNNRDSYVQTASGGITGGAVTRGTAAGPVAVNSLSVGIGMTLSVASSFYYTTNNPGSGSGSSAVVGFVGDSAEPLDFFSSSGYFWGEFASDGGLIIANKPNIGFGGGTLQTIGSISPAPYEHWFRLEFDATRQVTDWQLRLRLSDLGADGLSVPVTLFDQATTRVNPAMANDAEVFGGFSGYYHVSAFDNVSVAAVPEPSMTVLGLAGAGILFAATWLRRAKRRLTPTLPT